jgi:hypothetical protein
MKGLNLIQLALEVVVGRLVLDLPKDDLKKINEMILRNLENEKEHEK